MGNLLSQQAAPQPKVPMSVLISEISSLNQGAGCEMEVCHTAARPETDTELESFGQIRMKRCKKYEPKTHEDLFIPIRQLKLEHLPPSARSPGLFDLISYTALCTVRLVIRYTSTERPQKFQCGGAAGTSIARYGTGFFVGEAPAINDKSTFKILTAAHVVFDNKEAEKTTVEFFFDDDSDRSGVVTAQGLRVESVNVEMDMCRFICQMSRSRDANNVRDRCESTEDEYSLWRWGLNIAWCVSHPHGMAQRVSNGQVTSTEDREKEMPYTMCKILMHMCHSTGIDEKKNFYYCWDIQVGEGWADEAKKADMRRRLMAKGLIHPPTDEERETIQNKEMLMEEEFAWLCVLKAASLKKNFSQMNERDKSLLLKRVMAEVASQAIVPDGFYQRCSAMFLETYNYETPQSHLNLSSVNGCLKYSVPTCPGSSGALIRGQCLSDKGLQHTMAIHSLGRPSAPGTAFWGLDIMNPRV